MNTLLHTEVANRFRRLTDAERVDPVLDLMRIAVEVTRELMLKQPERVDEFLSHFVPQRLN